MLIPRFDIRHTRYRGCCIVMWLTCFVSWIDCSIKKIEKFEGGDRPIEVISRVTRPYESVSKNYSKNTPFIPLMHCNMRLNTKCLDAQTCQHTIQLIRHQPCEVNNYNSDDFSKIKIEKIHCNLVEVSSILHTYHITSYHNTLLHASRYHATRC